MSEKNMCAVHEMEERYSRLVIEYNDLKQKENLFEVANKMMKKYKLHPIQTMLPEGDFKGKFCLEFHDDYRKEAGEFFEDLLKNLKIDHCEIG